MLENDNDSDLRAIIILICTMYNRAVFNIGFGILRATACKYGESDDRSENSDFLLLRQEDPFGEVFSEIYFQSSSDFTFL